MTTLRKTVFFFLLAVNAIGTLGHLVILLSSGGSSDMPVWLTLLVVNGGAVAAGALIGRAGRPGLACLPLALATPAALYGIGIAALVLERSSFR